MNRKILSNYYRITTTFLKQCEDRINWCEDVREEIKKKQPKDLPRVGMAELKSVQLFTLWRKFVPDAFVEQICPKLPQDIIDKVKASQKEKRVSKKAKKEESKKEAKQTKK